jgi:DNA processing protein
VAVVGSRQCTPYGRRQAERLAADLCRAGFTVISGLARGIDAAAHRGALLAGGRTLAVLAGGLARIYPPEHTELALEVQTAGALLSEAPMELEPMAPMFPARNRLISGLARAVVIVEAASRSGALITARHAAEQNREVFAVPGPTDSPASSGCHELIRKGARLVRGVEDILEELGQAHAAPAPAPPPPPDLDERQQRLWDLLDRPRHIDELTRHLALPVGEVAQLLMQMEMKRLVRRLPGNQYERR